MLLVPKSTDERPGFFITMRRLFNESERWALYGMANGKCQGCGIDLHGIFHADHIKPYSKGGVTEIGNGQVLCGKCNMKKSNKTDDWCIPLRRWQEEAFSVYLRSDKEDTLINATPGAGKTIFGLRVAHHELTSGDFDQIIIVVPSENLKKQWAQDANDCAGINLATDYDASFRLSSDFHGIVTTYQAVAARHNSAKSFRRFTSSKRTLAIIDEIHHVGEGLNWAQSLQSALEPCQRRLSITGTPFRSDNNRIPFVEYGTTVDGGLISIPDFSYGYGDALRDGVVRPIYFQTFDGDASWFDGDGNLIEVEFSDRLPSALASARLRYTIHHKGDWLKTTLQEAHDKLTRIRSFFPSAGGLVVTKDKEHAMKVGDVLSKIIGRPPVIVTSDSETASNDIESFKNGNEPWIVAVKMVSEGISIKRLCVGVYATNVQTELFFRQVAGRILRRTDEDEEQEAHLYIPKIEPLTTYAESMKQERAHTVDDLDSIAEEMEEKDRNADQLSVTIFNGNTGRKDIVIYDGIYTPKEMADAAENARMAGIDVTDHNLIVLIKYMRIQSSVMSRLDSIVSATLPPVMRNGKTLEQQKNDERAVIKRMLRPIIESSNGMLGYEDINRELNAAQAVLKITECSLEQLQERKKVLAAWLGAWHNGTGREFTVKGYLRQRSSNVLS